MKFWLATHTGRSSHFFLFLNYYLLTYFDTFSVAKTPKYTGSLFFIDPTTSFRLAGTKSVQNICSFSYLCKFKSTKNQLNILLKNPFENGQLKSSIAEVDNDSNAGWGTGSLINSVSLVTGTAIGGGFLGLPYYTTKLGFLNSTKLLLFSWLFLNAQACVIINLTVASMKKNKSQRISIYTLSYKTLGSNMADFLSLCFFFLLNTTLVSQISKAGSLLSTLAPFPAHLGSFFTSILAGFFVFSSKKKLVDNFNTFLTCILFGSFIMLMLMGFPHLKYENLTAPVNINLSSLVTAVPVMYQFLVFHEIIPTLCYRLAGDVNKIKTAVILGSLFPLLMLLGWNTVSIGLVAPGSTLDPLDLLLSQHSLGFWVTSLAFSAVTTTVVGSYLALEHFFRDIFDRRRVQTVLMKDTITSAPTHLSTEYFSLSHLQLKIPVHFFVRSLTVLPSLCFALLGPHMFYAAVEFAGAFTVTALWCVAPPLMAIATNYSLRREKNLKPNQAELVCGTTTSAVLIFISVLPLLLKLQTFVRNNLRIGS